MLTVRATLVSARTVNYNRSDNHYPIRGDFRQHDHTRFFSTFFFGHRISMTIAVTCPSCLKRFSVSDKFAGKSGPCPSCKKTIKIPEKAEEVVIHAPEDAAPKDSKGRSVLKPIRRTEVNLSLPVILAASLTTIVIFGLALGFGLSGGAPAALLGIAAVVLAVPLVFVGYWFLHDDELDSFKGKELLMRCAVCGLLFRRCLGHLRLRTSLSQRW
jgi:hypothetical protein